MHLMRLLPLALATTATAQSLTAALASQNSSLSALISLIQTQPELMSALGNAKNLTILAPNNAALNTFLNQSSTSAALMADPGFATALLYYHVLNGTYFASNFTATPMFIPTLLTNATYENVTGGQVVEVMSKNGTVSIYSALKENATVVTANITFDGGVIHEISSVLTIPGKASISAANANLTDLVGALKKANLVDTVDSLKDSTIFAPTNGGFDAIGNLVGNLTTDQLSSILEYHVVKGTVGYSTLLKNESLTSLQGNKLTITVENGTVFVNGAKVVEADVLVAEGVVHVIDNVLNPSNATTPGNGTVSAGAPAFSGASSTPATALASGISAPSSTVPAATGASPTSSGAAVPMATGALGVGVLFGGAAAIMNL